MMSDEKLLEAESISFAYEADPPVLREVSMALAAGEVVALLGPNGSGKSTLIKVLLGHLRAGGDGSVRWLGRPVQRWNRRELARVAAYLPQSPMYDPGEAVVEVLRLGRAPYVGAFGIESERDVEVVREVARMLELEDLLDRPMESLSGGQRQRALVGRCLAQQPRALLLDEPGTFLDLKHQLELFALLRRLAGERGIGVLAASHDLNLSAAQADRLVLLDDGRVAAAGTPDEVLREDVLRDVYGVAIERIDRPGKAPVVVVGG